MRKLTPKLTIYDVECRRCVCFTGTIIALQNMRQLKRPAVVFPTAEGKTVVTIPLMIF